MKLILMLVVLASFFSIACKQASPTNAPEGVKPALRASVATNPMPSSSVVDVPKLADSAPKEFDLQFGEARKITKIEDEPKLMPGEYREYAVTGNPKGLSVRFLRDRAKRFNLLLGAQASSAEKAIRENFRIDVSELRKTNVDPLSESWEGESGGIKYRTVYAKRSAPGGKFVMLHAEAK